MRKLTLNVSMCCDDTRSGGCVRTAWVAACSYLDFFFSFSLINQFLFLSPCFHPYLTHTLTSSSFLDGILVSHREYGCGLVQRPVPSNAIVHGGLADPSEAMPAPVPNAPQQPPHHCLHLHRRTQTRQWLSSKAGEVQEKAWHSSTHMPLTPTSSVSHTRGVSVCTPSTPLQIKTASVLWFWFSCSHSEERRSVNLLHIDCSKDTLRLTHRKLETGSSKVWLNLNPLDKIKAYFYLDSLILVFIHLEIITN